MIIGSVRHNTKNTEGKTIPNMTGISATGCTVHFGTWNDYYYCELVDNTTASYTHDYQMSRLVEIKAIDGTTITYLDGTTGTVPASGRANYVIVDYSKGHGTENATCYHFKNGEVWTHDMGGIQTGIDEDGNGEDDLREDKQHLYLEFNNLFTGYGWGVSSMAINKWNGITKLDVELGDQEESVVKFVSVYSQEAIYNGEYKINKIFKSADSEFAIDTDNVQVFVSPATTTSTASGVYVADTNNWENGILTLSGAGSAIITITDYNFCTPTTVEVEVVVGEFTPKFTGDFLYRIGNMNTVTLGNLFNTIDINDSSVIATVSTISGNATGTFTSDSSDWTKGTIEFNGTGVVAVTIDGDGAIAKTLNLEVVDAKNATVATSATSNNVVLLNDCGFSSLEVSDGYTLYGNGFTMTCSSDSVALDMGYSFVTLNSGTLDNVQIVCPNFDHAVLYKSNMTESANRSETDESGKTRYYNVKSGVMVSGNSQILNSRISGARAAVNVSSGNIVIDNSRIELGAVASLLVGAANSVTLKDVTLVQKPTPSTYDSSKTLMGFSVLMICNSDGDAAPVTLEGTLVQNAWVDENDKQYVPSAGQSIISTVLGKTEYLHDIDSDGTNESLNLGFAYMPESSTSKVNTTTITDNRTNKDAVPYDYAEVSILNGKTYVYSYKNTNGTEDSFKTEAEYKPNKYSDIITVNYSDTADGLTTGKSFGTDGWVYELNVDLDKLSGYALDFSKLSMSVNGVTVTDFKVDGNAKPTSPVAVVAGGTTYTLTATVNGKEYTATYKVTGTETSKESPSLVASNYEAALLVGEAGSTFSKDTWHGAAPVLNGIQIKYWSVAEKQYKTITLSDYTPTTAGKQNGTEAVWTYTPDNGDFTLTIKNETAVHSSNSVYAMPVVVNSKLYFVSSGSNGLVNYGNSARTIKINYYFKDNNGGEELKFDYTWSIECADGNTCYDYSDFCNGTSKTFTIKSSNGSGCVTPDTQVTMADGSVKEIQDVTVGESVVAWDFYSGEYVNVPVTLLQKHSTGDLDVLKLCFEDGTELKVLGEHGIFDADLNTFIFIDKDDVENYIGHEFIKKDGNGFKSVKLVDYSVETEFTTAYTILSKDHYNVILEDMFTVTPAHVGDNFFNPFDIEDNMKYNEEKVKTDIEKYGLYTYDDFSHVLTREQFEYLNLGHFKVSVGKGLVTYEGIIYLIETFINGEY